MTWDEYFIKMATFVSAKSKDPSTKVGAVIVGPGNEVRSTGFNGAPIGCKECHVRPKKYKITEHAERNAVYLAARAGVSLNGCTMYKNFSGPPCTDCTRAVIQSGIRKVVGSTDPFPGKGTFWEEDGKVAEEMLKQAKIEVVNVEIGCESSKPESIQSLLNELADELPEPEFAPLVFWNEDGGLLEIHLENTNFYAVPFSSPSSRADACLLRAEDDDRVVGCVLDLKKPEKIVFGNLSGSDVVWESSN